MTRLCYLILFIAVIPLHANSQNNEDFIDYYTAINKAEKNILDSNYNEALNIYKSAYERFNFLFLMNSYTAMQTAVYCKDFDQAFTFLEISFKQGLKPNAIDKDSLLIELQQHPNWEKEINKFDSLRAIYISKIDSEYRLKLNEWFELDQEWRDKHQDYPWNFIWRPMILRKWKNITNNLVANKLFPEIIKRGFPDEKIVGVDEQWMNNKLVRDMKASSFAKFILVHYYSYPQKINFNEVLKTEVFKGNMSPSTFGTLMDFQSRYGKGKFYKTQPYGSWFTIRDTTLYDSTNHLREEIGLDSLQERDLKRARGLIIGELRKKGCHRHIYLFSTRFDS